MTQPTEVLYDVSQAQAALKKLDRTVSRSSNVADKGFNKAGRSAQDFGSRISAISPQVGSLVSQLGSVTSVANPASLAIAGVGLAVGAVVSNLIGLPSLLADTTEQLNELRTAGRRAQDLADSASSIQDAFDNFQFDRAREVIAERQNALATQQVRLDIAQRTARQELSIEQDKLRRIQAARNAAQSSLISAERQLQDKLNSVAVDDTGRGRTKGQQVVDLTAKAEQEARKGNVDLAEQLNQKAKQLSDELGNHVFFTDKVAAADKAIVAGLQKRVQQEAKSVSDLSKQATEQTKVVNAAKETLKIRQQELAVIRQQTLLLGNLRRSNREGRNRNRRTQDQEQAARDLDTGQREVINALNKEFSGLGDALKTGKSALLDFVGSAGAGQQGLLEISAKVAQAAGQLDGTPGSIKAFLESLEQSQRDLGELRATPGANVDNAIADRVEAIFEAARGRLGRAGRTAASAGVGLDQQISDTTANRESANKFLESATKLAASAGTYQQATEQLKAIASPQANVQPTAGLQPTSTPAVVREVRQTINVNATVTGGIIDAETTRSITAIIRRELRKETSNSAS